MAEAGIAALYRSLPALRSGASDPAIRGEALYGSWLSAICLASTSMGLHHKLCHTLGGALNLPHAETHTIVLPHAIAYNAPNVRDARSEEHTSELQSLMRISYAVFCLKKKNREN